MATAKMRKTILPSVISILIVTLFFASAVAMAIPNSQYGPSNEGSYDDSGMSMPMDMDNLVRSNHPVPQNFTSLQSAVLNF